jgi:O-antigen ligase
LPAERQIPRGNLGSSLLLFATIALAPLPFGSTDRTAIALWCVVFGLAAAVISPRHLRREQLWPLAAIATVVVAYLFVLHEQLATQPWTGAAPNAIWDEAGKLLGTPLNPSIAIMHDEPFFAIGAPLAAALAFTVSYVVCGDRHRAHQLLSVLAWSGTAYAVLGIILFMIDPTKVLWRDKLAYTTSLTSTFINRNTAAVYFGSAAAVCLLLLLQRLDAQQPAIHWRSISIDMLRSRRDLLPPAAMFVICFTAMLMSGSRAGVVFSLAGIAIAYFSFYRRRWAGRRKSLLLAAIAAAVAGMLVLQIFGGGVESRFSEYGVGDPARLATYQSTVKLIADHPWFGTGLGSYEWSFPAYRSADASIWGVWNRAHDTPLEIAAELGVPLAILVVALWTLALWWLWRGIGMRRRDVAIPTAAFAVAIIAILHSLIDFSLQIPGFAIPAIALMGAGIAQSFTSDGSRRTPGLG